MSKSLAKLWQDEFLDEASGLCALCGNSGYIPKHQITTPLNKKVTIPSLWCICPNGRKLKRRDYR